MVSFFMTPCLKLEKMMAPLFCLFPIVLITQVEVYTAAGLRISITRGCSEDKCSPSHDCKVKSRIGKCKSCCQSQFCNYDLPDVDAAVLGQCYNRYIIIVLSVLSMLLIFDIR